MKPSVVATLKNLTMVFKRPDLFNVARRSPALLAQLSDLKSDEIAELIELSKRDDLKELAKLERYRKEQPGPGQDRVDAGLEEGHGPNRVSPGFEEEPGQERGGDHSLDRGQASLEEEKDPGRKPGLGEEQASDRNQEPGLVREQSLDAGPEPGEKSGAWEEQMRGAAVSFEEAGLGPSGAVQPGSVDGAGGEIGAGSDLKALLEHSMRPALAAVPEACNEGSAYRSGYANPFKVLCYAKLLSLAASGRYRFNDELSFSFKGLGCLLLGEGDKIVEDFASLYRKLNFANEGCRYISDLSSMGLSSLFGSAAFSSYALIKTGFSLVIVKIIHFRLEPYDSCSLKQSLSLNDLPYAFAAGGSLIFNKIAVNENLAILGPEDDGYISAQKEAVGGDLRDAHGLAEDKEAWRGSGAGNAEGLREGSDPGCGADLQGGDGLECGTGLGGGNGLERGNDAEVESGPVRGDAEARSQDRVNTGFKEEQEQERVAGNCPERGMVAGSGRDRKAPVQGKENQPRAGWRNGAAGLDASQVEADSGRSRDQGGRSHRTESLDRGASSALKDHYAKLFIKPRTEALKAFQAYRQAQSTLLGADKPRLKMCDPQTLMKLRVEAMAKLEATKSVLLKLQRLEMGLVCGERPGVGAGQVKAESKQGCKGANSGGFWSDAGCPGSRFEEAGSGRTAEEAKIDRDQDVALNAGLDEVDICKAQSLLTGFNASAGHQEKIMKALRSGMLRFKPDPLFKIRGCDEQALTEIRLKTKYRGYSSKELQDFRAPDKHNISKVVLKDFFRFKENLGLLRDLEHCEQFAQSSLDDNAKTVLYSQACTALKSIKKVAILKFIEANPHLVYVFRGPASVLKKYLRVDNKLRADRNKNSRSTDLKAAVRDNQEQQKYREQLAKADGQED